MVTLDNCTQTIHSRAQSDSYHAARLEEALRIAGHLSASDWHEVLASYNMGGEMVGGLTTDYLAQRDSDSLFSRLFAGA
jgi:hypothetical protein